MFQFVQIGVQMLDRDSVVRADHGAFQEAPDALYGVGVNVAAHPFVIAVLDRLVARIGVLNSLVSSCFICIDRFRFRVGRFVNEFVKPVSAWAFDNSQSNLAVALNRSDNDSLVALVSPISAVKLSADISFINFNYPAQKIGTDFAHRGAYAVAEIPRGFVRDFDCPADLICGNSFFGFDHQIDGEKPFPDRQVRVVENRSAGDRKLIAALVAIVLVALRDCGNAFRFAARTLNAIRPFQFGKILSAFFASAESLDQINEVYV